jgi:hypothetical protein
VRTDDYARGKLAEMLEVARLMLANKCDLIEGCRRIVSLASLVGVADDSAVVPFRGFESETERFPRGAVRQNYAAEYLDAIDAEAEEYLTGAKTEILRSCGDLLVRFGA